LVLQRPIGPPKSPSPGPAFGQAGLSTARGKVGFAPFGYRVTQKELFLAGEKPWEETFLAGNLVPFTIKATEEVHKQKASEKAILESVWLPLRATLARLIAPDWTIRDFKPK
jgi:hypothetical protein